MVKASIQLAVLVLLGMLPIAFAVWLRVSSVPEVGLKMAENHKPNIDLNSPPVPEHEAATIAIEEVKKREGWTGFVDRPVDREGFRWYVQVWSTPRPHPSSFESSRGVTVDGATGQVLEYHRPQP
jgi:hypothetical protein